MKIGIIKHATKQVCEHVYLSDHTKNDRETLKICKPNRSIITTKNSQQSVHRFFFGLPAHTKMTWILIINY